MSQNITITLHAITPSATELAHFASTQYPGEERLERAFTSVPIVGYTIKINDSTSGENKKQRHPYIVFVCIDHDVIQCAEKDHLENFKTWVQSLYMNGELFLHINKSRSEYDNHSIPIVLYHDKNRDLDQSDDHNLIEIFSCVQETAQNEDREKTSESIKDKVESIVNGYNAEKRKFVTLSFISGNDDIKTTDDLGKKITAIGKDVSFFVKADLLTDPPNLGRNARNLVNTVRNLRAKDDPSHYAIFVEGDSSQKQQDNLKALLTATDKANGKKGVFNGALQAKNEFYIVTRTHQHNVDFRDTIKNMLNKKVEIDPFSLMIDQKTMIYRVKFVKAEKKQRGSIGENVENLLGKGKK